MRKKSFLANGFLFNPITAERSETVKHVFEWGWIKFDRLLCNEKKLKIFFSTNNTDTRSYTHHNSQESFLTR